MAYIASSILAIASSMSLPYAVTSRNWYAGSCITTVPSASRWNFTRIGSRCVSSHTSLRFISEPESTHQAAQSWPYPSFSFHTPFVWLSSYPAFLTDKTELCARTGSRVSSPQHRPTVPVLPQTVHRHMPCSVDESHGWSLLTHRLMPSERMYQRRGLPVTKSIKVPNPPVIPIFNLPRITLRSF